MNIDKIQVKCIFKTCAFDEIDVHHPSKGIKKNMNIVCSIKCEKRGLNPFYHKLREKDIETGYLLCYHYRTISIENCIHKLKTNNRYIEMKYTLHDLMSFDHPEIYDDTLRNKSLAVGNI